MIAPVAAKPAQSYEEALERARAYMARDDDSIMPEARTALFDAGKRTGLAVVLLHGVTNNPAQYAAFAPMLAQRGVNVFVPRMPHHGKRDRMTADIAKLTAEELIAAGSEAIDIACGLGERAGVLGISMGGSMSAYFAQHRELAVAVPVAPEFALLQLPYPASRFLGRAVLWVPNFFFWWDPRVRQRQQPLTAYPRCSTHALAQTLRVGDDVFEDARRERQKAERIVVVVNRCDPAVNNEAAQEVALEWSGWNRKGVEYVELRTLPENHDIIDPQNPFARTDLVYPRLIEALLG